MEVQFKKKFLKELAALPAGYREKIEKFAFEEVLSYKDIHAIPGLEKLKGYKYFYKKRFGKYRAGIRFEAGILHFERVLHRKEIYRYYP